MHIHIVTIGKWKNHPERELYNNYVQRSRWDVSLHELQNFSSSPIDTRKKKETQLLAETAKRVANDAVFVCDEKAMTHSSKKLASIIGHMRDAGDRNIAFIIGSDVGLDSTSLPATCKRISFGAMTWPHMLVRVLLAEQVYRVQTILSGHPYHRE